MDPFVRGVTVFVGGGIGASLRYWLGLWISARTGPAFPWNTLVINVTGSLLIGLIVGWLIHSPGSLGWRLFLVIGVLGGYTTFSSFAMETVNLLRERSYLYAGSYILATCVVGIGACVIGVFISSLFGRN
jgi:CrcB protein